MQKENNGPFPKRNLGGHWLPPAIHPDPILAAEGLSASFPERFLSKIKQTETCFHWTGAIGGRGTPRLLRGARKAGNISGLAASWILYNGEIPDGMKIFHACPFRNSMCLHPNHLAIGYQRDMAALRISIERHEPLSSEQLQRIKTLFQQAGESMDAVMTKLLAGHVTPQWMIDLGYSDTFAARFWSKTNKTDSCWNWTGALSSDGYGSIGTCAVNGTSRHVGAHVASYMLHKGPIPKGQHVCHNCPGGDNPRCVNPNHLWLGSRSQNTTDASRKNKAAGRTHWNAKLTMAQATEIRTLFAAGSITKAELGRKFGVTPTHIYKIIRNQTRSGFFTYQVLSALPHDTRTGTNK